jgi:signal transduction histidine kinase
VQGIEVDFQNNTNENLLIPFETGREYYLIFKEVVNNIAKHSNATSVKIVIDLGDNELSTQIADNGKGFNPVNVLRGNGLNNIEFRAARIKAECRIESSDIGTIIRLILNVKAGNT